MSVTVVVNLALFGIGELEAGPDDIHIQAGAFHQSMAVTDTDHYRQRKVGTQLFAPWPRQPEHSRRLEMPFEFRK